MPRTARRKSMTKVYHIMLRGIGQQTIFHDDEDYQKLLQVLYEYKETCQYELYAYCLMGNHIHLLIKENDEGEKLERIFRRIGAKYVFWYNLKYGRIGHLFQDRYKSEPVEDDRYLLIAMRYIHQNPVAAGIAAEVSDYPYSSYKEYVNPREGSLTDTGFILSMMNRAQFLKFNAQQSDEQCMEIREIKPRATEPEVKMALEKTCRCNTAEEFMRLNRNEQRKAIEAMRDVGASYGQIGRITGLSVKAIRGYTRA